MAESRTDRKQRESRMKKLLRRAPRELSSAVRKQLPFSDGRANENALSGERYAVDRTERAVRRGVSASVRIVRVAGRRKAKDAVLKQAQRLAVNRAQRATRAAAKVTVTAAKAVTRAATALVGMLAGAVGGIAAVAVILLVAIVGAIAASPLGIFFSSSSSGSAADDAVSLPAAIAQITDRLDGELRQLQEGGYDEITLDGELPDWSEVVAVFSCKYAVKEDGTDVTTLDSDRVDQLSEVFFDMTELSSEVETTTDGESGETVRTLRIRITARTADEMQTEYNFDEEQRSALADMLTECGSLVEAMHDIDVSEKDALEVLRALPADLPEDRRRVVSTALGLVGKVNYFWGGKSRASVWDDRWGLPAKVWADGSSTTGTYRPYGLDCTGFLDWTLRNAELPSDGQWHIGTNLTEVSEEDAQPGDMALNADNSHIGMVVGRDKNGELIVCHCSAAENNVVVGGCETGGFARFGRVKVYGG